MNEYKIFEYDPYLLPYKKDIELRMNNYARKKLELVGKYLPNAPVADNGNLTSLKHYGKLSHCDFYRPLGGGECIFELKNLAFKIIYPNNSLSVCTLLQAFSKTTDKPHLIGSGSKEYFHSQPFALFEERCGKMCAVKRGWERQH
jgi:hypothetical protein